MVEPTTGRFTRYPKRPNENPSVIDYALCGEALMPNIFSFSVLPFTELSDHCCISTNIRINAPPKNETPEEKIKLNPVAVKLGYEKDRIHIFQSNVLLSEKLDPLLTTLNKFTDTDIDLNNCIRQLNELILDAAIKSFSNKRLTLSKPKQMKKKTKTWFNDECTKLRKNFRKHTRILSKSPFDRHKLHSYNEARIKYKRACRKAEKESRNLLKTNYLKLE